MASSPLPLISLLFLALLLFSPLSPSAAVSFSLVTASSNVSTADASMAADPEPEEPAPEPTFLEEVVDAVSEKYDWDPDADVRVWPLDLDSVRVGAMQRYEFRARAGGSAAVARFPDEAVEWRHPAAPAVEEVDGPDGIDVIPADGALGFEHGVRDMELVGPVEVRIACGEDGGVVELQLPSGNATYTRLKKILVADGIALKVIGAQKVSLTHPHSIVSPRLIRLEKILKTWFSKRNQENSSMHFIEAKVTSVPLVKFRLELERDITEEDVIFENISEWKTKPMVQRVTLDIIAKVENDERLKAISVKKVRNPFPIVDAASWSSLTSNVSFTKFLSLVLPPEPLLLDVKW
ncbi:hypothetical protein QOZ80_3AG0214770 [Eleusine coracana subsp. coracana]|nr:hypothetical protein QOZ80_3AG0214770 [Eleusine coracana subsp. coracana]